jgi:hypothetical protein
VLYYDPLNQASFKELLDQMAHSLVSNALLGFTVVALNSPYSILVVTVSYNCVTQKWVLCEMPTLGFSNHNRSPLTNLT